MYHRSYHDTLFANENFPPQPDSRQGLLFPPFWSKILMYMGGGFLGKGSSGGCLASSYIVATQLHHIVRTKSYEVMHNKCYNYYYYSTSGCYCLAISTTSH